MRFQVKIVTLNLMFYIVRRSQRWFLFQSFYVMLVVWLPSVCSFWRSIGCVYTSVQMNRITAYKNDMVQWRLVFGSDNIILWLRLDPMFHHIFLFGKLLMFIIWAPLSIVSNEILWIKCKPCFQLLDIDLQTGMLMLQTSSVYGTNQNEHTFLFKEDCWSSWVAMKGLSNQRWFYDQFS